MSKVNERWLIEAVSRPPSSLPPNDTLTPSDDRPQNLPARVHTAVHGHIRRGGCRKDADADADAAPESAVQGQALFFSLLCSELLTFRCVYLFSQVVHAHVHVHVHVHVRVDVDVSLLYGVWCVMCGESSPFFVKRGGL